MNGLMKKSKLSIMISSKLFFGMPKLFMVNLQIMRGFSTDLSVMFYFAKSMLLKELLKIRAPFAPLILNVPIDMIIYSHKMGEKDGQV